MRDEREAAGQTHIDLQEACDHVLPDIPKMSTVRIIDRGRQAQGRITGGGWAKTT